MAELQAIGVRLDEKLLKKIDDFTERERLDRSTAMRLLIEEGYGNYSKRKAVEKYVSGKATISKAAELAGMTVWEFEQHLVCSGFKSNYSVEDLKEELGRIKK